VVSVKHNKRKDATPASDAKFLQKFSQIVTVTCCQFEHLAECFGRTSARLYWTLLSNCLFSAYAYFGVQVFSFSKNRVGNPIHCQGLATVLTYNN